MQQQCSGREAGTQRVRTRTQETCWQEGQDILALGTTAEDAAGERGWIPANADVLVCQGALVPTMQKVVTQT